MIVVYTSVPERSVMPLSGRFALVSAKSASVSLRLQKVPEGEGGRLFMVLVIAQFGPGKLAYGITFPQRFSGYRVAQGVTILQAVHAQHVL